MNKRFCEFGHRPFCMPWEVGARDELAGLVESGRSSPCLATDLACDSRDKKK